MAPMTFTASAKSVLDSISRLSRRPRSAGSKEDADALEEMRAAIESTRKFVIEEIPFEFERYIPKEWKLKIEGREVGSSFAVCSASTPHGGVSAPLRRSDSAELEGSVALLRISDIHESAAVEDLARKGALAAIAFQEYGPLLVGRVRYPRSSIPCMMVSADQGKILWERCRTEQPEVEILLRAETTVSMGTNLYATPREAVAGTIFTAHRDSRPLSPGALDNASGTAFLLYLATNFSPQFSLLSTDAEEYGLLGARAFAGRRGRMDRQTEVVNLDSIGSGPLHLVECSRAGLLSVQLNSKIESLARDVGVNLRRLTTPRGSDSDVFMEEGLESAWLRSYPTPTATTIDDTVAHVDPAILAQCCSLLGRVVESIPMS